MITRRDIAGRLGSCLLAWPCLSNAQQPRKAARIGFVGGSAPDPIVLRTWVEPLREGLLELGYVEGRDFTLEFRWHEGKQERLPGLLSELIALAPDVLVTLGPPAAIIAKDTAPTIPVVALAVDDPVAAGLAISHAQPGRNVTGLSGAFQGIVEKRLQLMKEIVPAARRFAVLTNPIVYGRARLEDYLQTQKVESTLGVQVMVLEARGPEDFDSTFATMARERVSAVAVLGDPLFWVHRVRLAELCIKHGLPSVWGGAGYLDAGGLVSYQGDFAATARRAATLIDKILKGTKPGDIPFEQATKLELVINLKAAKMLGVKIPQSVLLRADEVIQ